MEERLTRRRVGAVLFDRFELLDACGPLELFGALPEMFETVLLGPEAGPVRSAQGPRVVCDRPYRDAPDIDLALIPGGIGTRELVGDEEFLGWLAAWGAEARIVASICTGSGLAAAAGLLDGYRATSNKRAFAWVTTQGRRVEWVPRARWVEDGDRWSSAGVASGMDMTLALIARLCSESVAVGLAQRVEYDWHRDAEWDPFARSAGLVDDAAGGTTETAAG